MDDILQITAAGDIGASQLAGVSGIEVVKLFGDNYIDLSGLLSSSRLGRMTVIGSAGNDFVFADSNLNSGLSGDVHRGRRRRHFCRRRGRRRREDRGCRPHPSRRSTGGDGWDTLTLTSSGPLSVNALSNVFGFEHIALYGGNSIWLGQGTVGSTTKGIVTVTGGISSDYVNASGVVSGRVFFKAHAGYDNNNNTFIGGAGADRASGSGGDDFFDGGAGNDYLNGGSGYNTIYGGAGNDVIINDSGSNFVWGGPARTRFKSSRAKPGHALLRLAERRRRHGRRQLQRSLRRRSRIPVQFSELHHVWRELRHDDRGRRDAREFGGLMPDLVIYDNHSGPGLNSAAAVDACFRNNSLTETGSFIFNYNNVTGTGTLYYDSSTINLGGTTSSPHCRASAKPTSVPCKGRRNLHGRVSRLVARRARTQTLKSAA